MPEAGLDPGAPTRTHRVRRARHHAGLHLRSGAFFELLDALCVEEAQVGGPLITALVVNKRTGMPGQRFFVLAERLGHKVVILRDFVEAERQRAFEWICAHPERGRGVGSGEG